MNFIVGQAKKGWTVGAMVGELLKWLGVAVALLVVGPLTVYAWRHRWK